MDTFSAFISNSWLLLVGMVASILITALIAAAETAIVFSNKTRIRELSELDDRRAGVVLLLMQERDRLHSTVLLAENLFTVLFSILGVVIIAKLIPQILLAVAVAVPLLTLTIVIFAKLAPKGIACRNPDRFALVVSVPLQFIVKLQTFCCI